MAVTADDVSNTFVKAVLEHTGCESLKDAYEKLDIWECQTREMTDPELHSLLMVVLKTLKAELNRNHWDC